MVTCRTRYLYRLLGQEVEEGVDRGLQVKGSCSATLCLEKKALQRSLLNKESQAKMGAKIPEGLAKPTR